MSEVKPVDLKVMDNLILEVTANGGQYSQEFENWKWGHRRNWAAIKAEVEALRARVRELESNHFPGVGNMDKTTAEKMVSELISAYREFINPAIHEIDFGYTDSNYADARQKVVSALAAQVTIDNGEKVKE